MAVKTITVRLPQTTYEKLCQLSESLEELPSETSRNILRQFINRIKKGLIHLKINNQQERSLFYGKLVYLLYQDAIIGHCLLYQDAKVSKLIR